MRLRIIHENIKKHEFFDFYALLDAYQNSMTDKREIGKRLSYVVDHIYDDHMRQFGDILFNRYLDDQHPETMEVLRQYGMGEYDNENFKFKNSENLTIQQMAAILAQIIPFNHEHGFTGKTWRGLAVTFVELSKTKPTMNDKILAIDKIYNLLHHGGQITDYMDESDWLEDALNYRDNANPAQIFAHASPETRAFIGRASYAGQSQEPVSDLAKLYTALRRYTSKIESGISIEYKEPQIIIDMDFSSILYRTPAGDSIELPIKAWSGQIPHKYNQDNNLSLGARYTGKCVVTDDGDKLLIQVSGQPDPYIVQKPINRQYKLAEAIVHQASMSIKHNRPMRMNLPTFFFKDGRIVK